MSVNRGYLILNNRQYWLPFLQTIAEHISMKLVSLLNEANSQFNNPGNIIQDSASHYSSIIQYQQCADLAVGLQLMKNKFLDYQRKFNNYSGQDGKTSTD
jgi:hypothetical protein